MNESFNSMGDKATELEGRVPAQQTQDISLSEKLKNARIRLRQGKSTINQIRVEFGLPPLDDPNADKLLFTKE